MDIISFHLASLFFIWQLFILVNGQLSCSRMDEKLPCVQFYRYYNDQHGSKNESGVFNVTSNLKRNSKQETLNAFFCIVFYPPCGSSLNSLFPKIMEEPHVVPCQSFCTSVWKVWYKQWRKKRIPRESVWPWGLRCEDFPRKKCIHRTDYGIWKYNHGNVVDDKRTLNTIPILRDDDDEIEDTRPKTAPYVVVGPTPPRRYDVMDQGNPELFRGWADVQGTGASNDYCRVIGKGRRQFLACATAGSSGQDHTYVSQMGFDQGLRDSWYLRDMDNDGRDDYCRCIGDNIKSRVSCMKAEKNGFQGSPMVGGSQFSFDVIGSEGCYGQEVNPFTGL